MKGKEHYAEAERLIGVIHDLPKPTTPAEFNVLTQNAIAIAAQAQVHATLALAAAANDRRYRTPYGEQHIDMGPE